ncbi:MAG: hypothetical protein L3K11_08015, partial [Thermoplasmata archaeon]|nr:hypothetical protein [Thermoplasmata archaeon]
LARGPWAGRRILVIGGASREPIDEVRSVTNESSGATAVALASEAYHRGAKVSLWLGASEHTAPRYVSVLRWKSVRDLLARVHGDPGLPLPLDAIWVPAALSDFTLTPRKGKIGSHDRARLELSLVRAPKVLPELRRLAPAPTVLVAFKLESGVSRRALLARARELRQETGANWVVANAATNLGQSRGSWQLLPPRGAVRVLSGEKPQVAGELLDLVGAAVARSAATRKDSRPLRS